MILFAPAKINLGLQVKSKRPDGFHEIESCLYPIPFYDVLELLPAEKDEFIFSGLTIDSPLASNLCSRALTLLRKHYQVPEVYLHLHKNIPMGAGLGGGSSDAAYVIRGLKQLFKIGISEDQMMELAAELGSDCPFFIQDKPKLAKGRGEILSGIELDLSEHYLKLILPGIHVSTKDAYSGVLLNESKTALHSVITGNKSNWKENLINDFEKSVFAANPLLGQIKENLYREGAFYAAMSGSGSSLFGLFKKKPKADPAAEYRELILKL